MKILTTNQPNQRNYIEGRESTWMTNQQKKEAIQSKQLNIFFLYKLCIKDLIEIRTRKF